MVISRALLLLVLAAAPGCSALGLSKFDVGPYGECLGHNNRDGIDVETACVLWQERDGQCALVPRDLDGDGDTALGCAGGGDCDDREMARSSLFQDLCGNGGADGSGDEDCDFVIDENVVPDMRETLGTLGTPRARVVPGGGFERPSAIGFDPLGTTDWTLLLPDGSTMQLPGTAGLLDLDVAGIAAGADPIATVNAQAAVSTSGCVTGALHAYGLTSSMALDGVVVAPDATGCTVTEGAAGASHPIIRALRNGPASDGFAVMSYLVAAPGSRTCGAAGDAAVALVGLSGLGMEMSATAGTPRTIGRTTGWSPPAFVGGHDHFFLAFPTASGVSVFVVDGGAGTDVPPPRLLGNLPDVSADSLSLVQREIDGATSELALLATVGCDAASRVELVVVRADLAASRLTLVARTPLGVGSEPTAIREPNSMVTAQYAGADIAGTSGWLVAFASPDGPRLARIADASHELVDDAPIALPASGVPTVLDLDLDNGGGEMAAVYDPASGTVSIVRGCTRPTEP